MDGYNKDFSNYESFTESQHKAVTFINYCKIINAMGNIRIWYWRTWWLRDTECDI